MAADTTQAATVSYEGMSDDQIVNNEMRWARQESGTPAPARAGEKDEIHALMRDRSSVYWRGDSAEALQARYRELIDLEEQGAGPLEAEPTARAEQHLRRLDHAEAQEHAERLQLPAHSYDVPAQFADDELAQTAASLAGAAGLPGDLMADVFASRVHGGQLPRDDSDRQEGLSELRSIWGDASDANVQKIRTYVQRNLPPNLADALMAPARRSDGRALLNAPSFMLHLLGLANRGAQLSTGDLKDIQNAMRTPAYRKDPAAQVRYQYLTREQRRRSR